MSIEFSKTDMMDEFKGLIYHFARSASYVLDPWAGYRLLGMERPVEGEATVPYMHRLMGVTDANQPWDFLDPETPAEQYFDAFSIQSFAATRTVEQFYDYGISGLRNFPLDAVIGATEWTFAYGFISDVGRSLLVSESYNGEFVDNQKCRHAANAFFARLVLDGAERVILTGDEPPDDAVLTLAEVALLSGLDERTVRNATSKNASNRLATIVIGSNIYIPREAALQWLKGKRGYVPSRLADEIANDANYVLRSEFSSSLEAGDFIQRQRELKGVSLKELANKLNVSTIDIKLLEGGSIDFGQNELVTIGDTLGLNGRLLALRILEVVHKERLQMIRGELVSMG